MRLITCENGHRYDPDLTPECPECSLLDCGGFDFDNDFPDLPEDFLRLDGEDGTENRAPDIRTCEKGHSYDASLTKECPVCALGADDIPSEENTEEPDDSVRPVELVTCKDGHRYDPSLTPDCPECAIFIDEFLFDEEAGDSENLMDAETIQLPKLTGWLVGIKGPAWGRYFPLYEECNYIGTSPMNEVCIPQDETLATEKHCVIAYDDVDRRFYVGTGQGKSILRLNGRPVLMTQELRKGDCLRIGRGMYLFVPLCGEDFDWKDWPKSP